MASCSPRPVPGGSTSIAVRAVLGVLANGCSDKEIARRLVISRHTAERHAQNIYAKTGVSSRAAAARFAMEHGLLTTADR